MLKNHPFWHRSNPREMKLVRTFPLPVEANPFFGDGVNLSIACAAGETMNHKWTVAYEAIRNGVVRGLIDENTIIVEASSGNTGLNLAIICGLLGLRIVIVVPNDMPGAKLDVIRTVGGHVSFQSPLHGESTATCARRLGAQDGWHNPDQYTGDWNPRAHASYLMPQLFAQNPRMTVFVPPCGTMGTALGAHQYAVEHGLSFAVVPAMVADGQEIPAARTLSRVKQDVRNGWEKYFNEANIEFGNRFASFLLSYLLWRLVPVQLGPTSGLAVVAAFKFLRRYLADGTLNRFRHPKDGLVHIVAFGPDDYRLYSALYMALRFYEDERFATGVPDDLRELIDLA